MFTSLKRFGIISGLSATLLLAACGGAEDDASNEDNKNSSDNADVKYGEEMNYAITGIEPGAGVFQAAEKAVEEYGLDGWEVQASSSGAMATALGEAYENEEPIIVTGWSPHWKFAKYDLKYLEDPKEVFGGEETIHTMVREGLEDDLPEAYAVLDNFEWAAEDLEEVMLEITDGANPKEAASEWIEANEDKVAEWTEGVDEVSGDKIELVYVEWDTEIGSTNVIGTVLENIGYDVTITPLDNAVMWEAVATGEADGMVAAWLPGTHGELFEQYQDELVDLGGNLEGAKIGLVVPSYMNIDSIEDLDIK
ncbi:glycine betaine ABC transporter substrate-binding protein [Pseudogracilibacillus auburnensis]|uniref:Glycine betaine/proline transport system substrate-binding protein n=1 Tax=Pseudogracilibacillus auburnensis TaxID=1494959 RepID=A0A2V3VNR3_9BACI|nr:glycine betaine ABC transporter substrate-binding protein [Pseudogracilibacillus auburnensis]MBO1001447.1 glycine/betaine ABC transporter [Pseudogracilibacillus auburnensis]PXW82458.1 glycine betaine/proline transport system substrate-binding protein [Pseudogracilibacillus auburnensis]